MKKIYALLIILMVSFSACKKDNQEIKSSDIQAGTWIALDNSLQFNIDNLKGEGKYFGYLEYSDNTGRYLKVTSRYPDHDEIYLYLVKTVYYNAMVLVDTKDVLKKEITLHKLK